MTSPMTPLAFGCALLITVLAPDSVLAQGASLRFFSDANLDPSLIQRVRFVIGQNGEATDLQLPMDLGDPADSANGSFTIEFWLLGSKADNTTGSGCQSDADSWIGCGIVIDRDINGTSPSFADFGLSVCGDGMVRAGVRSDAGGAGACSSGADVLDDSWHHIALTRDGATGALCLFIDGTQGGCAPGPAGSASYDDRRSDGSPNGQDATLVLAAEKHGFSNAGFTGWLDEFRFSDTVRYAPCGDGSPCFAPPVQPFTTDADTVGLFHFDAAPGFACDCAGPLTPLDQAGTCVWDSSGRFAHGECRFGTTNGNAGPVYSAETPFAAPPSIPALSALAVAALGWMVAGAAYRLLRHGS